MRTMGWLVGAACLALLAPPAFAAPAGGSVQDCWEPAFRAGDADAVSQCYAEDAVLWLPGSPVMRGREAIRAGYADWFGHVTVSDVQLDEEGHAGTDDGLTSWGRFRVVTVSRDDGRETVEVGRYTDVSRRIDGEWQYVVDHASDDPPDAP